MTKHPTLPIVNQASTFKCDFVEIDNNIFSIRLVGCMDSKNAPCASAQLKAIMKHPSCRDFVRNPSSSATFTFDFFELTYMDDYGALILNETRQWLIKHNGIFSVINCPVESEKLLKDVNTILDREAPPLNSKAPDDIFVSIGDATLSEAYHIRFMLAFIGSVILAFIKVFRNPTALRAEDTITCMKRTGVDALPIVALISLLLGLIMAFMSSIQLKQFGANIYIASLVALAMVSELGPIMTAIVVAGRSASAFAAEIGTMKISEEIDALFTMGFDPTLFLAIPRITASMIVVPILTLFSSIFAIAGGLILGVAMLNLTPGAYITQTLTTLTLFEVVWGIGKSFVFAILIACIGCLRGFQARGGAAAVGNAATSAVVGSIFFIILFDSIFAIIRSYWV